MSSVKNQQNINLFTVFNNIIYISVIQCRCPTFSHKFPTLNFDQQQIYKPQINVINININSGLLAAIKHNTFSELESHSMPVFASLIDLSSS